MLLIPFIIYSLACLKLTNKCRNLGITWLLFMFFVCIGISFMMVQLLYTQQAIILLKNSFLGTVVLFSLLLVLSGIGSIYTNGLSNWKNKLFFILILIPLYNLLLPHMIASARPAVANSSIYFKTIILSAFIFPLGLLLGVFFPLGFLLSNQLEPKISFSWLYSMDILGSIVGILVGISLPIKIGYRNSIYCLSCLLLIQVILVFWLRWLSLIDKRAEERI